MRVGDNFDAEPARRFDGQDRAGHRQDDVDDINFFIPEYFFQFFNPRKSQIPAAGFWHRQRTKTIGLGAVVLAVRFMFRRFSADKNNIVSAGSGNLQSPFGAFLTNNIGKINFIFFVRIFYFGLGLDFYFLDLLFVQY